MMFRGRGSRTRRLVAYLKRREAAGAARWAAQDARVRPRLFGPQAVVYTDTADFTVRTVRDGILHFLMIFNRAVGRIEPLLRRHGGSLVKVEADSLLIRFPDVASACRGVDAIESMLRRTNRGQPRSEQLRFSYGIGYGEMLDLEQDIFGLEVNLASKLGEDQARPGEALLTPRALEALPASFRARVVPYRTVVIGDAALPVRRLRLRR